jgi:glycosyltransferase involved in cell wall biosynthesis
MQHWVEYGLNTLSPSMDNGPPNRIVSVIIPVKNDAERLAICLNSLTGIPANHIVVVDNGSSDHSLQLAENAGCLTLRLPNLKVGAMRNRGVELAHGEIIAFVDSDHEVAPDWLQCGVEALLKNEHIVAAGSHYLPPEKGTWVQRVWAIHRLRGKSPREVDWLGSGNLFVRRSDFLKVGGFREELTAAEDVDLCHRLRMELHGRIICDQTVRNVHHGEPKTLKDFVRKEYWRGSSGLRAWFLSGFPLRDIPSFLWPLWHLIGGIFSLVMLICAMIWQTPQLFSSLIIGMCLWTAPSILLSIKTCWAERKQKCIPQLAFLYFLYGLARAAALFKP